MEGPLGFTLTSRVYQLLLPFPHARLQERCEVDVLVGNLQFSPYIFAVVVDGGEAEVRERQIPQRGQGLVDLGVSAAHRHQQLAYCLGVHAAGV